MALPAPPTRDNSDASTDDPKQSILTDLYGVVGWCIDLHTAIVNKLADKGIGAGLENDGSDNLRVKAEYLLPTGMVATYAGTTAPTGWLLLKGDTIGSAASGATYAGASYQTLFELLWNSMADAQAPVSGGRGASASADFAADKTLTLPDARGRGAIGTGPGAGLTARTNGDSGGAETHTLTESEMPSHTHAGSFMSGSSAIYTFSGGGTGQFNVIPPTGGDAAHNNMPPWLALNFIIKL